MDELSIPSTAIYGGNLARTFEYHTAGVHATPHLHWSFPLREGATISCPVLVAEGVVYVGDSAGFFSAIDARSGDLLWCFATDWAQDEDNDEDDLGMEEIPGVTAFCLVGRLGYVASVYHTLYEVDLSNGQALRSWNGDELGIGTYEYEDIVSFLFYDHDDITSLLFYDQLIWFNDGKERLYRLDPETGNIAGPTYCGAPIMYRHPRDNSDMIYGYELIEPHPPIVYSVFRAINLSIDGTLWEMGEGDSEEVREEVFVYTVMDETLYVVYGLPFALNNDGIPMSTELLALDPFTGAVQWRYTIPVGEGPIQLAAASPLIFLVTHNGVEAVDTHTHQRRWKWISNSDDRHVLVADGLLFVLDEAGPITALDIHTGQQRWSWQTEQPIKVWFSTIADATLYIVMDHTLCAFH